MALAILRSMSSAECSMGLRSFLVHDEPLSAGRLKMTDGRLCEELEIKNLMRSSPVSHSGITPPKNGTSINGKTHHGYEYGSSACVQSESVSSATTSSSSVCSSGHRQQQRRRSITLNNNSCPACSQQKKVPSRTPSTASTSLSSNGTLLHNNTTTTSNSNTFRQQKLVSKQQKANYVEYSEPLSPTILVSHSHHHPQSSHIDHHIIPGVSGTIAPILINSIGEIKRCESTSSAVLEDPEICQGATLQQLRTQTSEEDNMVDEDELLDEEAGKLHNNERMVDDFEHMHLNGSLGPRHRRVLSQAINKEQILNYIANTSALYIRRSGTELQVTDSAGFPLIDVWQKSSCFHTTWVLESYGRTVLLLHSVGRSWKLWENKVRKSAPVLEVESADGELLGYFVVGDPFIIQNRERAIVARFNSFDSGDGRTMLYQCLLECSGDEIGRLEPRKPQTSQLRFGQVSTSFPLKLLILAAAVKIAAIMPCNQPNHSASPATRRPSTKRRNKSSCCSIV